MHKIKEECLNRMRINTDSNNSILRRVQVLENQQDQVTEEVKGMQHQIEECLYKKSTTTNMASNLHKGKVMEMRMGKK